MLLVGAAAASGASRPPVLVAALRPVMGLSQVRSVAWNATVGSHMLPHRPRLLDDLRSVLEQQLSIGMVLVGRAAGQPRRIIRAALRHAAPAERLLPVEVPFLTSPF